MGRVIMNGPPDAPGAALGTGWCVVCLMAAKQKQWETWQTQIQAGYAAPGDAQPVVIPWPGALTAELSEGLYRAVSGEVPMLGVVDGLCWNHVAGINPTQAPSGLDTTTKVPPGLLGKGKHR